MNKFFFSFLLLFVQLQSHEKYALVICAVFKNESFFLKQWIDFHMRMGVEQFYLYNNGSTDAYLEILHPYIEQKIVQLTDWPVETRNQLEYLTLLQLPAYNHALSIVKDTAHWAAFIDLDEFLCPITHENMVALLQDFKPYAGLAINWQTFGTSGIDRLDADARIIENFLWKAPCWWEINKYIKMVVQPQYVDCFATNPHYCLFKEGYYAVDSDKIPIADLREVKTIKIDTVRIHHYWFGDRFWFLTEKLERRKKWGKFINPLYIDAFIDSFNQEKDASMLRFLQKRID
jgi:hypothetical protein